MGGVGAVVVERLVVEVELVDSGCEEGGEEVDLTICMARLTVLHIQAITVSPVLIIHGHVISQTHSP